MLMHRRSLLAATALLLPGISLAQMAAAPPALAQSAAQPELPKEPLVIITHDGKRHVFHVEMAIKSEQQITGLMFRTSVPADGGMLFDWGTPRDSAMWMKNTLVPLDMLFIEANGRVHAIAENTVPHSLAPIDSGGPVRATLELAAGTAAKLDIRVGDRVEQRIFGNAKG